MFDLFLSLHTHPEIYIHKPMQKINVRYHWRSNIAPPGFFLTDRCKSLWYQDSVVDAVNMGGFSEVSDTLGVATRTQTGLVSYDFFGPQSLDFASLDATPCSLCLS